MRKLIILLLSGALLSLDPHAKLGKKVRRFHGTTRERLSEAHKRVVTELVLANLKEPPKKLVALCRLKFGESNLAHMGDSSLINLVRRIKAANNILRPCLDNSELTMRKSPQVTSGELQISSMPENQAMNSEPIEPEKAEDIFPEHSTAGTARRRKNPFPRKTLK